jgi:hypothetical protein
MTTIAQLEMLLSTLPSDIVGHIHDYAKHPVAEIFKEAQSSGKILLTHPTLRRFPTVASLISECHQVFEEQDDELFEQSRDALHAWYDDEDNTDEFDSTDWCFFMEAFRDLAHMQADLWARRGEIRTQQALAVPLIFFRTI